MAQGTHTMRMAPSHGVKGSGRPRAIHGPYAPPGYVRMHVSRTWLAMASFAVFASAVGLTHDWLLHGNVEAPDPRPRVHLEPLPPRVHPLPGERVRTARVFPDIPYRESTPMGTGFGSVITDPSVIGRAPMGTEIHAMRADDRAIVPPAGRGEMVSAGNVKPRSRPVMPVRRDDRDLDPPSKPKPVAVAGNRAVIGNMSSRRVSGNGGRLILEPRTMRMFAELESRWGERLEVRWAYRDPKLNRKVGGAGKSMHLQMKAMDIIHGGWSRDKMRRFVVLAYSIGFRGFGMGRNVIHIDTRPSFTSWNYGGNRYGLAYGMVGKGRGAAVAGTGRKYDSGSRKHAVSKKKHAVSKKKHAVARKKPVAAKKKKKVLIVKKRKKLAR